MQRGGIVLIFVAVAAVVGGGLYFLFGIYLPGNTRRAAQAEIERWEPRLDRMRACVLGAAPASPNTSEALAIRALDGEPDLRMCTGAIGELTRGGTDDTGIAAVEAAWRKVDTAAADVATSFALSVDPGISAPKNKRSERLAAALDGLSGAHYALREAASMTPPPPPSGKPLAAAELIPLDIKSIVAWLRPSAGGVVAIGSPIKVPTANDRRSQLILVPGAAPRLAAMRDDVRPSVGDPTWGAIAVENTVVLGKIDANGEVAPDTRWPAPKGLQPTVLFTLGSTLDGLVAFSLDKADHSLQHVAIARVAGGAVTAEPLHDSAEYAFTLDPSGNRGLLAWSAGGAMKGAILEPGTPTKIVDLGSGRAGQSCLTATAAWVSSGGQFVELAESGPRPHVLPNHELIGCSESSALLRRAGHRYSVCTKTCRIAELAARPLALPAIAGTEVVAVASKQRVLAVWREKGGPLYFTLPKALSPRLVHATAKIVDVIGETDNGYYAIARVRL